MAQVTAWMAADEGESEDDLRSKMNQKDLRQWKRQHPGHRSFTVLRRPVARAHDAFCRHILSTGEGSYAQLRKTLIRRYKLPLPEGGPDTEYDLAAHRRAFAAFLVFLKGNLSGQTAVRVDASWCTQAQAITGFGELCLPDQLIREDEMASALPALADAAGSDGSVAVPANGAGNAPFDLADIYDSEIEKLARDAYQRDYMSFGFGDWATV